MRDGFGNPLSPDQEAEIRAREPAQPDAQDQRSPSQAWPNPDAMANVTPVSLSGEGSPTPGSGHGPECGPDGRE